MYSWNKQSKPNPSRKRKPSSLKSFLTDAVISADGTKIGYRWGGRGAAIILLHGGLRTSRHYLALGKALAKDFTVYIPDRRGRGMSGPLGADYSLAKECQDLAALQAASGATYLFGHSAGAVIALEAAQELPFSKLILYEPPVGIADDWLPAFQKCLDEGNSGRAMAVFFKNLKMNWMSSLPIWALTAFSNLMANMDEGKEMIALLPTGRAEMESWVERRKSGSMFQDYARIQAETLLLGGEKSPDYLLKPLVILAKMIPDARYRVLPGLNHTAPDDEAPEVIAAQVKNFIVA